MTSVNIFSTIDYDDVKSIRWIMQNFSLIKSREEQGDVNCIAIKVDIERALMEVPPLHREIVSLVYLEGWTQAEVGEKFNITQQGVSKVCDQALLIMLLALR